MEHLTPLLKQYFSVVNKYPKAIVLMRVGDFYETYGNIAVETSKILGITLTKRSIGSSKESYNLELSGFPYHSLDNYLLKLLEGGYKVVLCDQVEDPAKEKGLVKREVTEVITPGLVTQDGVLSNKLNNYLAAIYFDKEMVGVSFLDITTGEFFTTECDLKNIESILDSFDPNEIIYSKDQEEYIFNLIDDKKLNIDKKKLNNIFSEYTFKKSNSIDVLTRHFGVLNIKCLGLEDSTLSLISSGAILQYLYDTGHKNIDHITTLSKLRYDKYMYLDKFTIDNLELVKAKYSVGTSLLKILDKTCTSMGARMLRKWLVSPLIDLNDIKNRYKYVTVFYNNISETELVSNELSKIMDIERLISKISVKKAVPNDFVTLKESLKSVNKLSEILRRLNVVIPIQDCNDVIMTIEKTISENPVQNNFIKRGVDKVLDEYKDIKNNTNFSFSELLKNEINATGISSLKIGYNRIFGYYFEVSNAHKNKVPSTWIRKQTLTSGERFINDDLKIFEEKILNADIRITEIEDKLFNDITNYVLKFSSSIIKNAELIAEIDCYVSFAIVARNNNYVCPVINDSNIINIKNGRHPVIECSLIPPDFFVPNDIYLDNDTQQIMLITGPNMAGKSALLREVALIVIMAQIGSFVPADYAEIGVIDRIFTRIGASDNISSGESTFMMEMDETANIIHNITSGSLILLDEIGRGTSTYDGISIAQSILEYIYNSKYRPKTLFSTHYHELCELGDKYDRISNYKLGIVEEDGKMIFLRKLQKGKSEHSFGINVAKLAGLPNEIVDKAREILFKLENKGLDESAIDIKKIEYKENLLLKELKTLLFNIDINDITPIEALNKLYKIKKMLE